MIEIPAAFLERMQRQLGDEYPAFQAIYAQPPAGGLRVNTLKITPQALSQRLGLRLEPVPGIPAGFRLPDGEPPFAVGQDYRVGKHPYHSAGLYYLQEPSAMLAAETLAPQPGEIVLDMCAAPGGKTTHLAALMGGKGALIANEIHPRRVWELAENIERCGVPNAAISNESPERLAQQFGPIFDRVLVDAPCSGEGMFRKSETARQEWSPALVRRCALRQQGIIDQAAALVRPGGRLVYSTCTFNQEENEQVIARLLEKHPHFELEKTLRLWPHRWPGEGHFIALLRAGTNHRCNEPARQDKRRASPPRGNKERRLPEYARKAWYEFAQSTLTADNQALFEGGLLRLDQQRLRLVGSYLYWLPERLPDPGDLLFIHPGLWLGCVITGEKLQNIRFEPSHTLAMTLCGACQQIHLKLDELCVAPDLLKYLRGETLFPGSEPGLAPGWALVTVEGFPLGWGKFAQGKLKNNYPRGLRWV